MKRTLSACAVAVLLAAMARAQVAPPVLQVNPLWPQPLPNHWVFGSITGVAVDAQDHVWVVHRGAASLEANEKGMMLTPPTSTECCVAAPFVLEFDPAGKLLSSWGGPGLGYQWPQSPGGIAVDAKGNVWIAAEGLDAPPPGGRGRAAVDPDAVGPPSAAARGNEPARGGADAARGDTAAARGAGRGRGPAAPTGPADAHVLKFARDGKFLLQIGTPGSIEGPDSHTTLNRPAAVAVDSAANEVYVADSGNHRIVVFDSETGAYKRHWGAYGEKPTAGGGGPYDPNVLTPARQFRDVTCVEIAKDGSVFVCDRTSNRIQVFRKDGTFVREGFVAKETRGAIVGGQFGAVSSFGSAWDVAFSSDPQQQFVYVADGHDKRVVILQRDTLTQVGQFGSGGRLPGQFLAVDSIATDSRGNVYTGEQHHGKRVQKFVVRR